MDGTERLDEFVSKCFEKRNEQPIEKLLLSLGSISSMLGSEGKDEIMRQIKRKLYEYKGVCISKDQMKKLLRVIVESNRNNRINMQAIDSTFKENLPQFELDTSNTILIGDKADESQYEFKSIIEDVNRGIESLEAKTQKNLNINLAGSDSFITERKNERQQRAEEIKSVKEGRDKLPRAGYEDRNWLGASLLKADTSKLDKCSEILSKINGIIGQKDRPDATLPVARKPTTYDTHFNHKMVTLLNELSDKLKLSEQKRHAEQSQASPKPDNNSFVPERPRQEILIEDLLTNRYAPKPAAIGPLSAAAVKASACLGAGIMLGLTLSLLFGSSAGPY